MRKPYKILLISILTFVLIATICFSVFVLTTDKLPYKNYSDFSTGSGYIYSKVTYRDSVHLIVMPNRYFYDCIKSEFYHDKFNFFYIAKLSLSNLFGIPIRINNKENDNLKFNFVDTGLISKYKNIDIASENYLNGNIFQDSLKWQDKKALTYLLLKTKIRNCSNDCETGEIVISKP